MSEQPFYVVETSDYTYEWPNGPGLARRGGQTLPQHELRIAGPDGYSVRVGLATRHHDLVRLRLAAERLCELHNETAACVPLQSPGGRDTGAAT